MLNNSMGNAPSFLTRVLNFLKVIPEFIFGVIVVISFVVVSFNMLSVFGGFFLLPYGYLIGPTLMIGAQIALSVLVYKLPKFLGLSNVYVTAWRAGMIVGLILLGISIGLASLNVRGSVRSPDTVVKSVLNSARAGAELYFDTHSASYEGFCASEEYQIITERFDSEFDSTFVCFDAVNGYAIEAPLVSKGEYYCVGINQNNTRTNGNTIGMNDFVCDSAE